MINNITYILSFLSEAEKLSYEPIFKRMIDSFQLYNYQSDIKEITYLSNGKTLDATLWLAAPLNENSINNMTFGMVLDTDLNQLPDYQIEVTRIKNGIWTKTVGEFEPLSSLSSIAEKKFLDIKDNYADFFINGKSYVILSADLDAIGSPTRYKALFYSVEINEENQTLIDFTHWINIPQPEILVSINPNPIPLRQGQETTVYVTINSTLGLKPIVDLLIENRSLGIERGIDFDFENKKITLPYFGTVTVPLHISIAENASIKRSTLPIVATLNILPEFVLSGESETQSILPITKLGVDNNFIIPSSVKSENITKHSNLVIDVEPSISIVDQLLDFLNKFQFPITFISGIITGNILPWVFNKLKQRRKEQLSKKK